MALEKKKEKAKQASPKCNIARILWHSRNASRYHNIVVVGLVLFCFVWGGGAFVLSSREFSLIMNLTEHKNQIYFCWEFKPLVKQGTPKLVKTGNSVSCFIGSIYASAN